MQIKKLVKYIAIVIVCFSICIGGICVFDRFVTPKDRMEEFYDEPKNTINTIIVGGSHAMCSISPAQLYQETSEKVRAFSVTSWSQPIWTSYHYIKEALKYQKPDVVIVEVFGALYEKSYMSGYDFDLVSDDFSSLIRPSLNLLELNIARYRCQVTKKTWDEYFNFVKYHTRIFELEEPDIHVFTKDDYTTSKGFGPIYTQESFETPDFSYVDYTTDLYSTAERYLRKTIEYCKDKGIKVVLYAAPYEIFENDVALLNRVSEIADEYGVDFIDCCSKNTAKLDYSVHLADHAHINYIGAQLITSLFADYFNSADIDFSIADEETKERWAETVISENNALMEMDTRLSKSFEEIVDNSTKYPAYIVVMLQDNNLDESDYVSVKNVFNNTVFENKLDDLKNSKILVFDTVNNRFVPDCKKALSENGITYSTDNGISSLEFDGQEYSRQRDGINVAVFNRDVSSVWHYISFDKEHGYIPYTN